MIKPSEIIFSVNKVNKVNVGNHDASEFGYSIVTQGVERTDLMSRSSFSAIPDHRTFRIIKHHLVMNELATF